MSSALITLSRLDGTFVLTLTKPQLLAKIAHSFPQLQTPPPPPPPLPFRIGTVLLKSTMRPWTHPPPAPPPPTPHPPPHTTLPPPDRSAA